MEVSIIIVNFNTPKLTLNCIESVKKYSQGFSYEIIVIDNASTDNSIDLLSNIKDINLIKSKTNLGFGGANNLGVNYSNGKFLFFLNSDTYLIDNAILSFLNFIKENNNINIGGMGQVLMNANLEFIHSYGFFPTILNQIFPSIFTKKEKYLFDKHNFFTVDYITGADLFIKKSLFLDLKGFDKKFFMYYEETDLQKRLLNKGYKNILLNHSNIVHIDGGSFSNKNFPYNRLKMQLESRLIYMRTHLNKLNYSIFKILYFIRILPSVFFFNCSFKDKTEYLKIFIK